MTESYVPHDDAEALRNPQWETVGRVHDWRNHVGENTKAIWASFSDEQRLAIAADADYSAGMEPWD